MNALVSVRTTYGRSTHAAYAGAVMTVCGRKVVAAAGAGHVDCTRCTWFEPESVAALNANPPTVPVPLVAVIFDGDGDAYTTSRPVPAAVPSTPHAMQATTAIRLGSSKGGVWHDDILGWAYTCRLQGCGHWKSGQPDPEHAVISLLAHERQDCEHRPRRRASDYERDDPEGAVDVPGWVELYPVGRGPGRVAEPAPALRAGAA